VAVPPWEAHAGLGSSAYAFPGADLPGLVLRAARGLGFGGRFAARSTVALGGLFGWRLALGVGVRVDGRAHEGRKRKVFVYWYKVDGRRLQGYCVLCPEQHRSGVM